MDRIDRNRLDPDLVDSAKRASDIVNTYIAHNRWEDIRDKFLAISLANGGTDGTLYDTRLDAVRHQRREQECAYVAFRNLGPGGASPRDMAIFLQFNRNAYKAGARLTDTNAQFGGRDPILTATRVDRARSLIPLLDFDPKLAKIVNELMAGMQK